MSIINNTTDLRCPVCLEYVAPSVRDLIRHLRDQHDKSARPNRKRHLAGKGNYSICGVGVSGVRVLPLDEFFEAKEEGLPTCAKCNKSAVLIKESIKRIDRMHKKNEKPPELPPVDEWNEEEMQPRLMA